MNLGHGVDRSIFPKLDGRGTFRFSSEKHKFTVPYPNRDAYPLKSISVNTARKLIMHFKQQNYTAVSSSGGTLWAYMMYCDQQHIPYTVERYSENGGWTIRANP